LNWLKIIYNYEPFCDGDESSGKRDEVQEFEENCIMRSFMTALLVKY
jgi:hypothetical protein